MATLETTHRTPDPDVRADQAPWWARLPSADARSGLRADDRGAGGHRPDAGVKAPIAEVIHCPLAFAGVHLLKELPERSAGRLPLLQDLNDDMNQCVLYDGTGPDAKLIGIEYLVSDAVYQKMPAEEKAYWHDHKYEVDAGLIRSLTQTGDDEKADAGEGPHPLGQGLPHLGRRARPIPRGPARLFWSVTGEEPFVLPADAKLPAEIKRPGHAE